MTKITKVDLSYTDEHVDALFKENDELRAEILRLRASRNEVIEMCAKVADAEAERLEILCNSVTVGGRAGKWAGGADAARLIEFRIRSLKDHSNG